MKFTKLSLVAALLAGSAAFAIDNVKMSGDANLFYQTSDANDLDLFSKDASAADAAINLNITADLAKNDMVSLSAGAGYTVLTTLGLENNLVSNVWGGAHTLTTSTDANFVNAAPYGGVKVENASWMNELWVAATVGNTTAKLGRMELDTPLAFTEKWTIEKNTFEAIAVINTDIPDTTLVGAYIGAGNGTETFGQNAQSNTQALNHAAGAVVNGNGDFATYGSDGAYAVGVINNSFKPLTVQAWYYDVTHLVEAYWLQADLACQKIPGLMAGVQYSGHKINSTYAKLENTLVGYGVSAGTYAPSQNIKVDSDVYAVMLGYEVKDLATVKVAYSQVGKDFAAGFNTATSASTAQSKLYTEAWWGGNFGYVTQTDTTAYNLTVEAPVAGVDLGAYITYADQDKKAGPNDLTEVTVTAGKSFGPLDATLAYIYADYGKVKIDGKNTDTNTVQAYLTLNF